MKDELKGLFEEAEGCIKSAENLSEVSEVKVAFLGRKGKVTNLLNQIGSLPAEERPAMGRLANEIKKSLTSLLEQREKDLKDKERKESLAREKVDVTLPGFRDAPGARHPLTSVMDEIVDIFQGMGFWVELGPDAETDYYNFEALNFKKDHPARDMQATLYLEGDLILRTHTSPVQIRAMRKHPPPVRIICPGRVYRCDSDISHSPMFHQVEGFMVDDHITLRDLKGVLFAFLREFFGPDVNMRFRPSFFPFTEPSAEVDISCVMCGGKGCSVCKRTGWLEILGSGQIHPRVLVNVGYDPEKVNGFAFGMGVERIAMLKYGIDNIRAFFENDLRFLRKE
jgi:phenylalanyl-tRNA synthetase alpha chain